MKYVLPVLLTIGCVVLDHLFLAEMERGNHPKAVRLKGLASLCFVLTGLWFTVFAGGGAHHDQNKQSGGTPPTPVIWPPTRRAQMANELMK